ncbi:MAG TPA: cyclophilin-like fold protein [Syntrophobacteraceae bacterium]|nr:cyclophilin-like fold protein [Syntrophobacteraceae bacterium]
MMRKISIRSGEIEIMADLDDSPTAQAVFASLPLCAAANTWGDEIYFEVPVHRKLDATAVELVQVGDIGYWPSGPAFCIFFGPTPVSSGDEIRPASAVNLIGRVIGDARVLKAVHDGDLIELDVAR